MQGGSSAAALLKLIEKKKEFDAVSALERASTLYLERIEGLGEEFDVMANAGEVHGQVLAQWPKMFQILNEFLSSRDSFRQAGDAEEHQISSTQGQRLIRVPIEELQETKSDES
jgi:DASH complex subunit DAD2